MFDTRQEADIKKGLRRNARLVSVAALVTIFCFSGTVLAQTQTTAPVLRVTSCLVVIGGHGTSIDVAGEMMVRFVNDTSQTFRSITWRANTPAGTLDFNDDGTFSPGVSIYRHPSYRGTAFRGPRNHPALEASGPGTCVPIKTISADGAVWNLPGARTPAINIPNVPADSAPSVPATFDNPSHDPIGIVSCQFAIVRGRAFGHVRFRNLSDRALNSVRFRAFFGPAGLDFDRQGTFSPGVLIDTGDMRRTDLPRNAFDEYLTLDSPGSCTAVSATYSNGSAWRNVTVPATEPLFPKGN